MAARPWCGKAATARKGPVGCGPVASPPLKCPCTYKGLDVALGTFLCAASDGGDGSHRVLSKPGPTASDQEREEFITAKYVERRFVSRRAGGPGSQQQQQLQDWLWDAARRGDLQSAYQALAAGANLDFKYSSQPAAQLVWESNLQAGGTDDQPVSPSNLGGVTVLHAACRVSGLVVFVSPPLLLLLQPRVWDDC